MLNPSNLLTISMLCAATIMVATAQVPTQDSAAATEQTKSDSPASLLAVKRDVPLTPTAQEAVRVSEKWRGESISPVAGADGRVVYNFGAGLPTVVCAPLRVCIVELQPGEKLEGEPQIGDSVRWNIAPALYGNGDQTTPIIVLKPQLAGLDTNLLITTDRRAYYLRLISKPVDYVARVAFQYPLDQSPQKWQDQLAEQREKERQTKAHSDATAAMIAADKLNFEYKVTCKSQELQPVRVFDDGSKTYIQMPGGMQNREAPVLLIIGNDGKGEMSNYRVKQQTYIVDRLFDRAQLILGAGKKAQKVEIARVAPRG
jgi:type IV secretion system protein VirB9